MDSFMDSGLKCKKEKKTKTKNDLVFPHTWFEKHSFMAQLTL